MTFEEAPNAVPPPDSPEEPEPDDESRATDPEWDPVVVFEGDGITASLVQADLEDAGIETALDDSETDVIAVSFLKGSEGLARVLVSRHDEKRAQEILERFEEEIADEPTDADEDDAEG